MAVTRLKRKDRKNFTVSRLRKQHLKLHARRNFPRPVTAGMPNPDGTYNPIPSEHATSHERHTESQHNTAKAPIDNSANETRAEGFRPDTHHTSEEGGQVVDSHVTSGSNANQSQADRNAFYTGQADRQADEDRNAPEHGA